MRMTLRGLPSGSHVLTLLVLSLIALACDAALIPAVPVAASECWRPTIDDVDRISWGRPAKKKGTGSRGVPHRLNDDERTIYDLARRKGFVEIGGTGWRRQRSDAPLVNTYRSWCDARAIPAIYLHKAADGMDEVVADLSPLRTPLAFEEAAAFCLSMDGADGGNVEFEGPPSLQDDEENDSPPDDISEQSVAESGAANFDLSELEDAYRDDPIYRLPMYAVAWTRPRPEAKALAKSLASHLNTAEVNGAGRKGRAKAKGAPRVKPGKSRQHGGYGIG